MVIARTATEEAARIVKMTADRGGFAKLDDGFVYYWPSHGWSGAMGAWHLRILADELDRRNKKWNDEICEYLGESA